ncbi:hypothetical protein ABIA00_003434 [Bradyrhizobium ottawaense]|uniref:type IV toxin-antitoxin system AbiEi family antitoxin domain-containing protein n=1 Tax=Bradyrhizobium ottawaense TaxID=931866 RepID=UPI0038343C35
MTERYGRKLNFLEHTSRLFDELPHSESFHQADMLVDGLRKLNPRKLQKLLDNCRRMKVKRLFFWFADRHNHFGLEQIDR